MQRKYPKESYIIKDGDRRKILEELGDLRFVSSGDIEYYLETRTVKGLEEAGWVVEGEGEKEEEEWPKIGDVYWSITMTGARASRWNGDEMDRLCQGGLGIYKSEQEALDAFERAKKAVKE